MKYCLTLLGILLFSITAHSQNNFCGTTQKEREAHEKDPSIYIEEAKLKQFVQDWIASNKDDLRGNPDYIIPVVFHVVHDYGSENITDAQVRDAVRILNEDYQKMNADTTDIISSFKSIAASAKIEFRLANKTATGQCTNGIDHIHSLSTYAGGDNSKPDDWNRAMYLNVWTIRQFSADVGIGVVAYAYLPSSAASAASAPYDGVIILSSFVGSTGTGNYGNARTLTHEIGHMFGLLHPWGPTNNPGVSCGDDDVNDTPETQGWTYCNLNGSVCNPPVIENVQNYMDYSFCSRMFTAGQVDLMNGTLNYSAASRNNLWTTANLSATGTSDTIEPLCAPKPDFYSNYKMSCTGSDITFHDVSWGGAGSSRSWIFQDGVPGTSTDKDPLVSFSLPGWKTVTLTVINSVGTITETRNNSVYISDNSVSQYPVSYWESFNDQSDFSNNWIVQNPEGNSSVWSWSSNGGSAELNNYSNMAGDIDNLISPSFDLSTGGPLYLNFLYTCATHTHTTDEVNDALNIYSTVNCGQNWFLRASIKASDLANAGYVSGAYSPSGNSPWAGKSILLTSSLYQPNVRFRFEYKTNGYGNNIYLDDVQVQNNPVGVNDPDAISFALNVYPNPISENSVAVLNQRISGNMNVYIIDVAGRIIKTLNSGWLGEGEHRFDVKKSDLTAAGMYYLIADDGITVSRQKLVVQ